MQVVLLGSGREPRSPDQFLTGFLVDGRLAIDAGALGLCSLEKQGGVTDVLVTHAHLDHLATLPVFIENTLGLQAEPVRVHAGAAVLDSLRRDLFNDRVWPRFHDMSLAGRPFLTLHALEAEKPVRIAGMKVTPVAMNHPVPTFGYVLEKDGRSLGIAGDTGPTERFWEVLNAAPGLAAVYLEASFPDAEIRLAEKSGHLTPALFAREFSKLTPRAVRIAYHLKPRHRDRIEQELLALGMPGLEIGVPDQERVFA